MVSGWPSALGPIGKTRRPQDSLDHVVLATDRHGLQARMAPGAVQDVMLKAVSQQLRARHVRHARPPGRLDRALRNRFGRRAQQRCVCGGLARLVEIAGAPALARWLRPETDADASRRARVRWGIAVKRRARSSLSRRPAHRGPPIPRPAPVSSECDPCATGRHEQKESSRVQPRYPSASQALALRSTVRCSAAYPLETRRERFANRSHACHSFCPTIPVGPLFDSAPRRAKAEAFACSGQDSRRVARCARWCAALRGRGWRTRRARFWAFLRPSRLSGPEIGERTVAWFPTAGGQLRLVCSQAVSLNGYATRGAAPSAVARSRRADTGLFTRPVLPSSV
jgi:hypothetical protein